MMKIVVDASDHGHGASNRVPSSQVNDLRKRLEAVREQLTAARSQA